jgi:MoaA/NifB/PqqE/SkfB family radical SAM enzyme
VSPPRPPGHPPPAARFAAEKRGAVESFRRFARGEGLPAWPLELFLEVSNVCDLRCAMCLRFSALNPNRSSLIRAEARGFMELAGALDAVSELLPHALVVNVFGYGEPTLHPAFAALMATLASSEVLVEFFTSGMHLDRELADLLVADGVHRVTLSFSGSTREEYEQVYLGSDLHRVLGGLATLRESKRAAASSYPRVEVNSLAFRHHVRTLDHFVALMAEHGADQINLTPLHEHANSIPALRGHGVPPGSLAGDPVVARAEEVAVARGLRLSVHPVLRVPPAARRQPSRNPPRADEPHPVDPETPLSAFPELARRARPPATLETKPAAARPVDPVGEPDERVRERLRVTSIVGMADQGADFVCLEPFKSLYVRRNGEVKACCYMVDDAPALGHVGRSSGAAIWNGSGFRAVRDGLLYSEYPLASCSYCLLTQEAPASHGLDVRLRDYARWHAVRFAAAAELDDLEVVAAELERLGDGRAIVDRMAARGSPILLRPDLLERAHRLLIEAGGGRHPEPDLLEGYLDTAPDGVVSGWVWSPSRPELRFPVTCRLDGRRRADAVANGFRADLVAAGKGDGRYAFAFRLEESWGPHRVLEVSLGESEWQLTAAGVARRSSAG